MDKSTYPDMGDDYAQKFQKIEIDLPEADHPDWQAAVWCGEVVYEIMFETGLRAQDMMDIFGVSRTTVWAWRREKDPEINAVVLRDILERLTDIGIIRVKTV